jgi:hypothetical protein
VVSVISGKSLAWLASQAWPRLMPCFDGEASEVLIHPLGPAFNVGDDHANHLSNGHVLWAVSGGKNLAV